MRPADAGEGAKRQYDIAERSMFDHENIHASYLCYPPKQNYPNLKS
jgi:hypothetical protein